MTSTAPVPGSAPSPEGGSTEFSIDLCGPPDREEQARLFNACFKKATDAEGLSWRYDSNPDGGSISVVARPPGGEGVSGYACSPRRVLVRGKDASSATVGQTGDVMTHPDWRKRGIFSDLDRRVMAEAKEQGWPLVFGLPNRRSAHIFLKLGWERVGTIRPWTFVLQKDERAKGARMAEGRLPALMVGRAHKQGQKARARLRALGADFHIKPLSKFPMEVEHLSRTAEVDFDLMVRRSAPYLEWRFLRAPSKAFECYGVHDSFERFVGYFVVQRPRGDDGVGHLVDMLAPGDGSRAAALEGALSILEGAGASVVRATAIDGSWWRDQLVASGFQPPKDENHLTVIVHIHDPDHPLAEAARKPESWYLTDGDRDDETIG